MQGQGGHDHGHGPSTALDTARGCQMFLSEAACARLNSHLVVVAGPIETDR